MLKKIMKIKKFKLLAGFVCLAMVVSMLSGSVIPVANAYSNEETESTETEQRSDETEKEKEKTVSEENEDKENNENEDKEDDTEKTDNEQNIKQPEIKTFDFAKNIQFLDANECKIILKTDESIPDDNWIIEEDNYTQTVSVTSQTIDLPILSKKGYYFGGWKTKDNKYIYCKQGTNSTNANDKCEINVSGLAGQTIVLEPIWYKYSIDITQAVYDLPTSSNNNTLILSHINSVTDADINDILKTINNYGKILKLSYNITYQDNDGNLKELTRTDVSLSLNWEWAEGDWEDGMNPLGMADFRDVITNLETCLTSGASLTSTIRLSDAYLKQLIVQQEQVNFSDITEKDIAFSNWGYFDTNKNNYCNGDADLSALKVQLGNTYNKDLSISGNSDYMIDTVSPSNVSIDLFDYWIDDQYLIDHYGENIFEVLSQGVNKNHGLLFRKNASEGSWNGWTGDTGGVKENIVKSQLNDNGYPDLNIEEGFKANGTWITSDENNQKLTYSLNEDLSYLFDVDEINEADYGVGYKDVKGLFKINEDGNYYYSSHDNFAEFDKENNRFNVYNTWGVYKSGTSPDGQFYPFNSANQVFKLENGNLQQSGINAKDVAINHYLGLTMDVDFQQPVDGMVSVGTNGKPMVFDFSGDDDVWIFIDGVLVADLGGIHDEMSVSIDFSTGNINISRAKNPNNNTNISTTLKEQFENAKVSTSSFNGNTFGNNTTHQLKMFYLERGNYDSNLTLSFNLMEPMENELIKLDQNGEPVKDAEFEMYVATMGDDNQPVYNESTGTYEVDDEPILSSIKTDENGRAVFPNSYDYGTHDYYVLREKETPDGYFTNGDILLRYDRYEKHQDGTTTGTNLLLVDNRWTTGAVANFSATVYQSGTLNYDDDSYGEIESGRGQNGLILAIPMMKDTNGNWLPLYGSNMMGYNSVTYDGTTQGQRKAILEAALYQIYHAETQDTNDNANYKKWYLEWDEENGRYQGNLNDLPGDASRYYWASGDINSDLTMSYYFLDMESLIEIFGETQTTTDEKFNSIEQTITSKLKGDTSEEKLTEIVKALVDEIEEKTTSGSTPAFALLDVGDFNRVFASRIYVSNVQPQLGVQKLDENGNPLEGVEFTLYSDEVCTNEVAKGTTDENGLLVFSHNAQGNAQINFEGNKKYWLKETKGLDEYSENKEVIPVYVTANGRVYADALEENDGITVRKGLGKLLQTMVRYAGNGDINATLRDISAQLFTVDSFDDLQEKINSNEVSGAEDALYLHYGLSNALLEYGTHEVNGVSPNPYFEVDSDIAGLTVNQNYDAHEGDALYSTVALKTNLEDTNIRGLFTGSTVVVVQNRKIDSLGQFSITKTVSGLGADKDEKFTFDVKVTASAHQEDVINISTKYAYKVTQKDGEPLEIGQLSFIGNKDDGWSINGVELDSSSSSSYIVKDNDQYVVKLKDNQTITVEGLPFGLTVTVTENGADDYITSVSVNNGQWNTEKKESGIIAKPIGNPSFVFNNHKDKFIDLTITKKLPDETDSTKAFPFEITLRDQVGANLLSGEYQWKIVNADNDQAIEDSGGRKTSGTITNGTLTTSLKHNEKIIIEDIPVGSTYIIKETTQGYTPAVTVNDKLQSVVDGAISGTINNQNDDDYVATDVVYSNTRSGSITITKRDGYGNLLSGAGFTLYYYGDNNQKVQVGNEKYTALAERIDFEDNDSKFDEVSMRYNDGTASYIVHTDTDNQHFYYRFLTESEIQQFYNGSFAQKDYVEAIVQFDELKLNHEYCIEETTVPNGYMQNADISETMGHIKLPKTVGDGNDQVVYYDILYTVTNHAKMVLPTTGLHGIHNILAIAIVFVVFALIVWKYRKKIYSFSIRKHN